MLMPPLQCSKDAVVLVLARAETGRSSTIADDAQLRRAQPQAGDGSGYCSASERPQNELGRARASGGRHTSQLVVDTGEGSLEPQLGRRHTQTTNMQLSLMTADRIQLAVAGSPWHADGVRGGSAQSGPVVPRVSQTPMSTFQVPESSQAPGAACET